MLFTEYGEKGKKVILCMHGMCQDWRSEYDALKPLENEFRLIIPAMDGFYENCPCEFNDFSDQARQIEEYVNKYHGGHLNGIFGASQGGLMIAEILARGNIDIDVAVTDGIYIAHQGRFAAYCTYWMMKYFKKHRKPPKVMDITMSLMGLDKESYGMFDNIYWDASLESIKKNLIANYTYRADPKIAVTKTNVYLWCGSKEPYALKSHRILKRYLKECNEEVFEGLGHGELLLKHQAEMCERLICVFNQG